MSTQDSDSEDGTESRELWRTLGGATALGTALAGCLGDDDDEEEEEEDDLEAANFEVSDVSLDPTTADAGEEVTATADITNTGEQEGTQTVSVEVNGVEEASEEITLDGDASETVSATFDAPDDEGDYDVTVSTDDDSQTATLSVEAVAPPDPDEVQLAMVIDLQRCTGCQGCNIACKNENNVEEGHAWADRITITNGEFPDASYEYVPTLCNHCDDAPCIDVCPVAGDALYKGPGGITMQNRDECIGCEACVGACPYDKVDFNDDEVTHAFWRDDEATMPGVTASPQEVVDETTHRPPYQNRARDGFEGEHADRGDADGAAQGTAEKCTFCVHRVAEGELPACVEACPSDARIFGNVEDDTSTVSQVLDEYDDRIVDEWYDDDFGTEPNVWYIREFDGSEAGDPLDVGKGEVPEIEEL